MSKLTHIEVKDQDGNVVRSVPYHRLVTLQLSDDSEPIRYIAMSWKGRDARWAERHFATPDRSNYTLVCRGKAARERVIGRFRIHLCNTYRLKKKFGGALYASLVIVAEDHFEKLQAFA